MKILKVTLIVESSEEIYDAKSDGKFMDDIIWSLENNSEYVNKVFSIDVSQYTCDSPTS